MRMLRQEMAIKCTLHDHAITDTHALFVEIDEDESGYVNENELATVMEQLGISLNAQQISQLVATLDHEGDGWIDYEELLVQPISLVASLRGHAILLLYFSVLL